MDAGLRTYRNIAEKEAREELIVSHLFFVKHVLGKLLIELPAKVDVENLEAAGILGLVESAHRFDPDRGANFKTFAYRRIRGAILDELRRNCPLPQQVLQNWSLIRKEIQSHEGPISPQQIAQRTELSVDDVEKCLVAIRMTTPEAWSEDLAPIDLAQDERADSAIEEEQTQQLTKAIEKLPEQMRAVVTLYYIDDLTLKQIGEVIGLSESRVSRILTQAELQLKKLVQQSHPAT